MLSKDIKFIDLTKSDWDREKSDPENGIYVFAEGGKAYLEYSHGLLPPHHVTWCRYAPESKPPLRDLHEWRINWGYEPVKVDDYDYIPEGVPPNSDGWFVFSDLVLVKTDLIKYVEKREQELALAKAQRANKPIDGFQDSLPAQSTITDDMIAEITGKKFE